MVNAQLKCDFSLSHLNRVIEFLLDEVNLHQSNLCHLINHEYGTLRNPHSVK